MIGFLGNLQPNYLYNINDILALQVMKNELKTYCPSIRLVKAALTSVTTEIDLGHLQLDLFIQSWLVLRRVQFFIFAQNNRCIKACFYSGNIQSCLANSSTISLAFHETFTKSVAINDLSIQISQRLHISCRYQIYQLTILLSPFVMILPFCSRICSSNANLYYKGSNTLFLK